MAGKRGGRARSAADGVPPRHLPDFGSDLKRRQEAARGLERDLLTSVPLLYGSPGEAGDPGIVLARAHREDMLRRNGGGASRASGSRSDVILPWERATMVLPLLIWLIFLFFS
jgi:hypothetical protein